ncbi:MAG TPA: VOC family protein [Acidobacteriaceae bacterium]|nr:VOC family protein [Acidobacteriaceae bacterium]
MSSGTALQLHHIGYAAASIGPIAASYVSRYGYELVTPIIHDPLQTALVQFLKLRGDCSYLELVAPDGPESKLANAVKRGSGLNHLCFIAGPLEEAISQLEEAGMRLISEPKPGLAFAGRRICWLIGDDLLPIELVERSSEGDLCPPGLA